MTLNRRAQRARHAPIVGLLLAVLSLESFAEPMPRITLTASEQRELESRVAWEWQHLKDGRLSPERLVAMQADLRRLFAASPSLITLHMYGLTLSQDSAVPNPKDLPRNPAFQQMKDSLSRDFAQEPAFPPLFVNLNPVATNPRGPKAKGKASSAFTRIDDVVGWAWIGQQLAAPERDSGVGEINYSVAFDAGSIASLAPVYEMAKRLRVPVSVVLAGDAPGDLEQSQSAYDVNRGTVTADLPAFAVTARGLVAGRLKSVGFFGGACASDPPTAAVFSFAKPIDAEILGVFVSAIPVDPARAKVQLERSTFVDVGNTSLDRRVGYQVDLDADGTIDLYGVSKYDAELDWDLFSRRQTETAPRFMPVAGWYANDFNYLDANVNGRWLRLSLYSVVTCS